MAIGLDASKRLVSALRGVVGSRQSSSRSYATCTRVDKDGTRWVRLLGSDTDTPVNGSSYFSSDVNDLVEVEISNGVMSVVGNVSSPAVGQRYVANAMNVAQTAMDSQLGDAVVQLIKTFGTTLSNALSDYLTSTQTGTAISTAINTAFNMSSSTSKIAQAFATAFDLTSSSSYASLFATYLDTYVISPAISVAEGVLNANIARAVEEIDIGGRNLLNNTGWDSKNSLKLTLSSTDYGEWYRSNAAAYLSYDSDTGLMSILTSATSNNRYGYRQRVKVESSTTYVLSAEVGDSYHIGISTSTTPEDSGGWTVDGNRVWKTYTTGSSETSLYVFMYAQGGSTPSPCKLNRVMLEKANKPSEWDFNERDLKYVTDVIRETADSAYDIADNLFMAVGGLPDVVSGSVGQSESISGGSYRDYTITFATDKSYGNGGTFTDAPNVTLTIYTTSTATTFDCDIYLRSVSTTGFTARIVNRETNNARSPGFHWQAVGFLAD